jgi:hypothetical protein
MSKTSIFSGGASPTVPSGETPCLADFFSDIQLSSGLVQAQFRLGNSRLNIVQLPLPGMPCHAMPVCLARA